jgi:hypothetical protein
MSTMLCWIPPSAAPQPCLQTSLGFHQLHTVPRAVFAQNRDLPAAQRRLLLPGFIQAFQWERIRPLLPWQLRPI